MSECITRRATTAELAADETATQCGTEDSSADHEDRYAMAGWEMRRHAEARENTAKASE